MQAPPSIFGIKHAPKRQGPGEWASNGFVLSAGALLLFAGLGTLIGLFGSHQVLGQREPVLGLPVRALMLPAACASLLLALACLFGTRRQLAIGLVGWLAATFVVFRTGMGFMGSRHSAGFPVPALDLSFGEVDLLLSSMAIYLLLGSLFIAGAGMRASSIRSMQAEARGFPTLSCPGCGGHIQFALEYRGHQTACPHCGIRLTLHLPEDLLKMSCFFCNQHIEFPPHALGRKLKCPHCRMDITLKEPTDGTNRVCPLTPPHEC